MRTWKRQFLQLLHHSDSCTREDSFGPFFFTKLAPSPLEMKLTIVLHIYETTKLIIFILFFALYNLLGLSKNYCWAKISEIHEIWEGKSRKMQVTPQKNEFCLLPLSFCRRMNNIPSQWKVRNSCWFQQNLWVFCEEVKLWGVP